MTDKDTEGNEGSGEGLFVFNWMYLSMIKNWWEESDRRVKMLEKKINNTLDPICDPL